MASNVVQIIRDGEAAHALLQPIRIQILENLAEPGSASSLSPSLGIPRQQVNYHLRELEKAGFVEFVEERKRGNCIERIYRSVADSFVISPETIRGLKPDIEAMRDRSSSDYVVALGSRLIDDLAELRANSEHVPTLAVETSIRFADDASRARFAEELARAAAAIASKYHTESGSSRPYRMVWAVHPEIERRS
ncbi:MAG: hypothetical protein BGO01_18420 [Armatimonadetes bacterium 55-13]|nr:helix-turn-helix domain-containing protein [Armatimonadota bacterium]OJU64110.1 MAG: hypothetical protein BGO01_18420 [Armatimonadetes bacterium 55-13]